MSNTKRPQRYGPPRERTTLALTGTVRTTEAGLCHSSAFALAYAQSWLSSHGSKKVPTGGVIRRALAVYITHLEGCPIPADEVREAGRACTALLPDPDAQKGAYTRLGDAVVCEELPPQLELLRGPQAGLDFAALNARVEAHIGVIAATRWGRLKGIK